MGGGCTEMWQQRSHRRTQPIMLGVAKPPISGEAQMAKVRGPKGRDQENAGAWFFGEGVASTSPHHLGGLGSAASSPSGRKSLEKVPSEQVLVLQLCVACICSGICRQDYSCRGRYYSDDAAIADSSHRPTSTALSVRSAGLLLYSQQV